MYPKKIFCRYYDLYNKILVSNGKSLIINSDKIKKITIDTLLDKTALNVILDKEFIISKMNNIKQDETYPFYYVFNFDYENILIKVFFDKKNLDLIGWETRDIYQNLVQTFISTLGSMLVLKKNFFNSKVH